MKLTLSEISKIITGELIGKAGYVITGAAPIETATPSDITLLSRPKYENFIETTAAGCIIVNKKYDLPNKNFIIVKNPQEALVKILEIILQENKDFKREIHHSAVVSQYARLGENISIGAHSVISLGVVLGDDAVISANCFLGRDVKIGKNCFLYPNVVLYDGCILGDRVLIHSGSVIGADGFGYLKSDGKNKKIPQIGIVKIGNDVEIGSNTSIDRATMGATQIGDGTKIDNLVQISHNVKIGKNCIIAGQTAIAGSTVIGDNVTIAGQVGIAEHIKIGDNATIAGGAGVIGDIKSGETVSGYPARPHAKAMRLLALIEKLPEIYEKVKGRR